MEKQCARKRQHQVHTLPLLKSKNNRENGRLSLFMAATLSSRRRYYGRQFWRERKLLITSYSWWLVWQIFLFLNSVNRQVGRLSSAFVFLLFGPDLVLVIR